MLGILVVVTSSFLVPSSTASMPAVAAPRGGVPACAEVATFTPTERDEMYRGNVAQYLVDLHDARGTFDFCGGMMFQLVLSDKLRAHLAEVAEGGGVEDNDKQPAIQDASTRRMAQMAGHERSAAADNIALFHGREVRQVDDAAGGMGMALHLSLANSNDPEGWTAQELKGYDGWGHDSGRQWRDGAMLEGEGFSNFRSKFGQKAYTLHHRFYWHLDQGSRLWLSAEDGCEGVAGPTQPKNLLQQMLGQ